MLVVAVDDKTFADLAAAVALPAPLPRPGDRPPAPRRRAGDRLRRAVHRADDGARRQRPHRRRRPRAQRRAGHRGDRRARRHQRARRRRGAQEHRRAGGGEQPARGPRRRPAARRVRARRPADARHRRGAAASGHPPSASSFPKGGAWIDFHGPPGTIDTVSFSDLVKGRVDPARVRGRVVVVGAASPTLQDVHPDADERPARCRAPRSRPTRSTPSSRGMPLRRTPTLGRPADRAGARRSCRRWSACACAPLVAAAVTPAIAFVFLLIAQRDFDHGRILPVAMPLFALALGTVTTISAGYAAERRQRFRVTRRNVELEEAVRERTVELRETQLEVIHRLAHATESRDQETGMHLERISRMCERLGLALGMTRDRGRDAAQREPAARRGQDRRPRRDPAAARRALAPRTASSCAATRRSARAAVGRELRRDADGRGDRPHPSRALGRRGLSRRPGRRGDPARGAHLRGVRRLRRAALRSPLQGAVAAPRGARPAAPRPRHSTSTPRSSTPSCGSSTTSIPTLLARGPSAPAAPAPADRPAPPAAAPRSG